MCRNGRYTERGIKERDGYCSERFRVEPEFAVRLEPALAAFGVLLEPATIVAKAWEHVERIGQRARWMPRRALVTGAGPIGLLAALLAKQRGLEVHVLDRNENGPKPALVRALGARYHTASLGTLGIEPDILIECTGAAEVIAEALCRTAHGGIVCLTGLSSGRHEVSLDLATLDRSLVLENDVVFGSVNANRRHYEAAARALAEADRDWLGRLITRRLPLEDWAEAFTPGASAADIKTIIDFRL
jgi:threonine dehydrogenase-like Zn-dependent dehydrogenase